MRNILDFQHSFFDLGPAVPGFLDPAGHPPGDPRLRPSWRALLGSGASGAVLLDEQPLDADGQGGAARDLWPGVPLLSGNGGVCSISEFPTQRPGRQLS